MSSPTFPLETYTATKSRPRLCVDGERSSGPERPEPPTPSSLPTSVRANPLRHIRARHSLQWPHSTTSAQVVLHELRRALDSSYDLGTLRLYLRTRIRRKCRGLVAARTAGSGSRNIPVPPRRQRPDFQ